MANYQSLKAAINAVIKANGNKEITGTVLNEVLLAMVNSLGAGYQFAGVATPSTNPGTPDQKVFYIASQAGTYTNFNGAVVSDGIAIFEWNGTWTTETLDLSMVGQVQSDWTETDTTKKSYIKHKPNIPPSANVDPVPTNGSPNAVASGGVYNALKAITDFLNNGYYFVGIAGTSTVPDSVTQYGIFYIASDGGTYTNFLNGDDEPLTLYQGLNILYKDVEDDGWNYFEVFNFSDFVDTTQQQSLSSQQKAQARTNIAAVSYDQQPLSADQQVQAQNNVMGKAYAPAQFSGLGKKVLSKNMQTVGGVQKNVMTQAFFQDSQGNELTNTIFVIQYDYILGGNITIPVGCTLQFDGGSISNASGNSYTMQGNATSIIYGNSKIFGNVGLLGTFSCALSPIMFGLFNATSDSDRFDVLYQTHVNASNTNSKVDYAGINSVSIEMPTNDRRLPLSSYTDFHNCKLIVKKPAGHNQYLFVATNSLTSIQISKSDIDSGDFSSYNDIASGTYGLIVKDKNVWCVRTGYTGNDAYRKDILLVSEGEALNHTIMPYNNTYSDPECEYFVVNKSLTVKNAFIQLDTSNIVIFDTKNNANVSFENITISNDNPTGNYSIPVIFTNCYDVTVRNVRIYGNGLDNTQYSYCILLKNVANFNGENIIAKDYWHTLGESDGLNGMMLRNCNVNPDCHFYGKDFHFVDCDFRGAVGNSNNVYGNIIYDNCVFNDYLPVLIDESYTAYTPFNLILNNCKYITTSSRIYLYYTSIVSRTNAREELKEKCMPNLFIKNMEIELKQNASDFVLFRVGNSFGDSSVANINTIYIDGLKIRRSDGGSVGLSAIDFSIPTKNIINYCYNGVDLIPYSDSEMNDHEFQYSQPFGMVFGLGTEKKVEINRSRFALKSEMCPIEMTITNSVLTNARAPWSGVAINKKVFKNCTIYFNNNDDSNYYLYTNAVYDGCRFMLKDITTKWLIAQAHQSIELINCVSNSEHVPVLYNGTNDGTELLGMIATASKFIYTYKVMGTEQDKPVLNSNFVCLYRNLTSGKLDYWNGTAWASNQ